MGYVWPVSVTSLLLLSAALAAAPEPGLLGVRFQTLAEGAVITEVIDGMGAAAVGVQVGDRILAVDGAPVDTRGDAPAEALRARLLGEPGTDVALTLGGPLGGPAREVVVRRGLVPPDDAPRDEIIAFRRALDRGTARAVKREAKQLVRADFGGLPPRVAVATAITCPVPLCARAGLRSTRTVAPCRAPTGCVVSTTRTPGGVGRSPASKRENAK